MEQITAAGGIDLSGADININGVRTTVPNLQYEVAQNIQEIQGLYFNSVKFNIFYIKFFMFYLLIFSIVMEIRRIG
jgi:hypothetical protein